MDWKLPEIFQRPFDFFNSTENSESETKTKLVHEDEDDLGLEQFQHKGTLSFRRVESAVHTFVDVALPADLDRLRQHQSNIKKWRKEKYSSKLRLEYINSSRTIKQLRRNLNEMEILRSKVLEADLSIFDRHLSTAKEKAKDSIKTFFELHGEELSDVGHIANLEPITDEQNCSDFGKDDVIDGFKISQKNTANDSLVLLQGNKLVIESSTISQNNKNDVDDINIINNDFSTPFHDSSLNTNKDGGDEDNAFINGIQTLEIESENTQVQDAQAEKLWEDLRGDIVDLHSVISDFSSIVHDQGETVDDIEGNIENAAENIKQGTSQLRGVTLLKAALFPVLGAVVGGVVAGPIGMMAGLKLGSVTTGLAAAGATGTFIGYQGGKALKKHQDANTVEMKKMNKNEVNSTETEEEDSEEEQAGSGYVRNE